MNQQAMMRKLMKMKQEMEDTQKEIAESEYEMSVDGVVTITALGTKEITKVEICKDFKLEDEEDYEMLEDSIVAAYQKIFKAIEDETEEKMGKYNSLLGGFGGF